MGTDRGLQVYVPVAPAKGQAWPPPRSLLSPTHSGKEVGQAQEVRGIDC